MSEKDDGIAAGFLEFAKHLSQSAEPPVSYINIHDFNELLEAQDAPYRVVPWKDHVVRLEGESWDLEDWRDL